MVIAGGYISEKTAAKINKLAADINSYLGRDAVLVANNTQMEAAFDISYNGNLAYCPATMNETEALLYGIKLGLGIA